MKRLLSSSVLGPVFGITLLVIVFVVLFKKISGIDLHEMQREIRHIPTIRILLAVFFTACYYATITGYDTLAFRVIKHPLRYRRIALAAFTGYAFGHNVGLSFISSGSVRYRIHSSFGLKAAESAKVIAFCSLTYWVGLLTVCSSIFLLRPMRIPGKLHLPFHSVQAIGWIALAALALYWVFTTFTNHGLRIGKFTLPRLSPKVVLTQMMIGSMDWILGSLVLYLLLPHAEIISFPHFFEIFVLAQIAGQVSQLPGGIGVFEGVMMALLPKYVSPAATIGSLLLYRAIFYILPLIIAATLLALHEVRLGRAAVKKKRTTSGR